MAGAERLLQREVALESRSVTYSSASRVAPHCLRAEANKQAEWEGEQREGGGVVTNALPRKRPLLARQTLRDHAVNSG